MSEDARGSSGTSPAGAGAGRCTKTVPAEVRPVDAPEPQRFVVRVVHDHERPEPQRFVVRVLHDHERPEPKALHVPVTVVRDDSATTAVTVQLRPREPD